MYATLVMGGGDTSHKQVDKSRSWILNLYYTNKTVLFLFCALNEVFFIALYLLSFSSPLLSPSLLHVSTNGESGATLVPGNPSNPSAASLFANPYSAGALELARGKQNGLILAMGHCWHFFPRHGWKAKSSMSYNWSKPVDGC
ncbi:hypothetical protein DID88_008688 [Monilinia fructigena]|uniref:Uncharacterized protein n=1 Tax=Monilinia fructigena TaxID=38457 RepID=A0A395J765_9HELO|nr:hypothetical protein DID88_008688 [Monilinia fructigena]